jgi:hypothetical protein
VVDHRVAAHTSEPTVTPDSIPRAALAALVILAALAPGRAAVAADATTITPVPQRERAALFRSIDASAPQSVALLEELVNLNSGTFNVAGVRQVGDRLQREFQALGFTTRWVSMDAVGRAPHLVAERRGRKGRRLLLIGHMDTVFEPFSPFRSLVRNGERVTGPGVYFDANFSLAQGDKQQHAVLGSLLAELPGGRDAMRKAFERFVFE